MSQPHPHPLRGRVLQNFGVESATFHCISQGSEVGFTCLRFSTTGAGRRMFAPVIKNMRNMNNLLRTFAHAQRQIEILRQIEFFAKSTQLQNQIPAIGAKMSSVHERIKKLGAPFRLKKWTRTRTVFTETIFVAVKKFSLGMQANGICQFVKRERREHIIMIDKCDDIAGGEVEGAICILGDTEIFLEPFYSNTRFDFAPPSQCPNCFLCPGTSINYASFPIAVALRYDRLKQFVEEPVRGIENWNEQ